MKDTRVLRGFGPETIDFRACSGQPSPTKSWINQLNSSRFHPNKPILRLLHDGYPGPAYSRAPSPACTRSRVYTGSKQVWVPGIPGSRVHKSPGMILVSGDRNPRNRPSFGTRRPLPSWRTSEKGGLRPLHFVLMLLEKRRKNGKPLDNKCCPSTPFGTSLFYGYPNSK